MTTDNTASIEDVLTLIPEALTGASARTLGRLARLQLAKTRALVRESAHVGAVEGEDSVTFKWLAARRLASTNAFVGLNARIHYGRIAEVAASENAAIVHGVILTAQGDAVAGGFVRVLNERELTLAEARTDAQGYFRIDLKREPAERSGQLLGRARREVKSDLLPSTDAASGAIKFRLEASDSPRAMNYRDQSVQTIRKGEVSYMSILLSG